MLHWANLASAIYSPAYDPSLLNVPNEVIVNRPLHVLVRYVVRSLEVLVIVTRSLLGEIVEEVDEQPVFLLLIWRFFLISIICIIVLLRKEGARDERILEHVDGHGPSVNSKKLVDVQQVLSECR